MIALYICFMMLWKVNEVDNCIGGTCTLLDEILVWVVGDIWYKASLCLIRPFFVKCFAIITMTLKTRDDLGFVKYSELIYMVLICYLQLTSQQISIFTTCTTSEWYRTWWCWSKARLSTYYYLINNVQHALPWYFNFFYILKEDVPIIVGTYSTSPFQNSGHSSVH